MKQTVTKVSLVDAIRIILDQKADGTFFSVEAIKRSTGELRYYKSCRGGVSKFTNGKGMAYDPTSKGLIGIWEAGNVEEKDGEGKDKYRMISAEGIKAVVAAGIRYEVVPA